MPSKKLPKKTQSLQSLNLRSASLSFLSLDMCQQKIYTFSIYWDLQEITAFHIKCDDHWKMVKGHNIIYPAEKKKKL